MSADDRSEPVRIRRMEFRSLEERWPMSPEVRKAAINSMVRVLADTKATHREKTAATRALIAADKVNVNADVASKMPDRSQEDASDEYDRASRILDRFADRLTDQRGAEVHLGGMLDGTVRDGEGDGSPVDAEVSDGDAD